MNKKRPVFRLSAAAALLAGTLLLSGCETFDGIMAYVDNYIPPTPNQSATSPSETQETTDPTVPDPTTPPEEPLVGVVTNAKVLNVRSGPGQEYEKVGTLDEGAKIVIYEQRAVGSSTWGRTKSGWVSMNYIVLSNGEVKNTSAGDTLIGTVTGEDLTIRSGPGTSYEREGSLSSGDKVQIVELYAKSDTLWGKTLKGWVSLSYVQMDGCTAGTLKITGKTTAKQLTIRAGAGVGNEAIGTYSKDTAVTITAIKSVSRQPWGKTEKGWICLDYFDPEGALIISAG